MDLLNSILGGVAAVGEGIDKFTGGRALRGLAAGHPRELLSALPFSDTLGLTDEHERQSGRDVTDAWGLTNKGDHSFGAGAIGLGADALLNPLALTGAGMAVAKAPTLGSGLLAAAKHLSGLDLLESLGRGTPAARGALAGFVSPDVHAANEMGHGLLGLLRSEEGSANVGKLQDLASHGRTPPNPIDAAARSSEWLNPESRSMAPRRFSEDPAKKAWYARHRAERTGNPDSLLASIQRFMDDSTGSLAVPKRATIGRLPAGSDPGYGLATEADTAAAHAASEPRAFGPQVAASSTGGYRLKAGRIPASPGDAGSILGLDPLTKEPPRPYPVEPTGDELVNAYYRMSAKHPIGRDVKIETYVPPPEVRDMEPEMRTVRDMLGAARQGAALRSPTPPISSGLLDAIQGAGRFVLDHPIQTQFAGAGVAGGLAGLTVYGALSRSKAQQDADAANALNLLAQRKDLEHWWAGHPEANSHPGMIGYGLEDQNAILARLKAEADKAAIENELQATGGSF